MFSKFFIIPFRCLRQRRTPFDRSTASAFKNELNINTADDLSLKENFNSFPVQDENIFRSKQRKNKTEYNNKSNLENEELFRYNSDIDGRINKRIQNRKCENLKDEMNRHLLKPEEKFKNAYGHVEKIFVTNEDNLLINEPVKLYNQKTEESPRKFSFKLEKKRNYFKLFNNRDDVPCNNFTSRFHKQELLDFFDFHSLSSKEFDATTEANKDEKLLEQQAPLYNMPYYIQLERKQQHIDKIECVLKDFVKKYNKKRAYKCTISNIIGLEKHTECNNTSELAIDGDPTTVGAYLNKRNIIVSPKNLPNIKNSHKFVIEHFENFLRLPCNNMYSYQVNEVWADLKIKSNSDGELMVSCVLDSNRLQLNYIKDIKKNMKKYFTNGPGEECYITSMFIKYSDDDDNILPKWHKLFGENHLITSIDGQSFIIEPDTEMHQCTEGVTNLYRTIRNLIGDCRKSTILDLCCGSGGVGIHLAPYVNHVLGLDSNPKVIEEAIKNAELNNLKNCTYMEGRIQEKLTGMANDLNECGDVIAIINAPQCGIGGNGINIIRQTSAIKMIVYVSQRPCYSLLNMTEILNKDTNVHEYLPFLPVHIQPIDMNPNTINTQVVVLYKRMVTKIKKASNLKKYASSNL